MNEIESNYQIIKLYEPTFAKFWKESKLKAISYDKLAHQFGINRKEMFHILETSEDILKLHPDYMFIRDINIKAAKVWIERMLWKQTHNDLSEELNISPNESRQLFREAKFILNNKSLSWTKGLSNGARNALLRNGYKTFKQVLNDIEVEGFNFGRKDSIGPVLSEEILYWAYNKA